MAKDKEVKASAKKAKSAMPSVLAFEKKLVPSDAQMFAVNWAERHGKSQGLALQLKSVRGTISNRLSNALESDPAKLDAEVEKPNLQTVDHCALPSDCDTLKVRFTLKVLSGVAVPSACNNQEFNDTYREAVEGYIGKTNFTELAKRYATNLANARFLWRNRVGAEAIEVVVTHLEGEDQTQWTFDAKAIGLHDFDSSLVATLAQVIADSLSGKREFALLDVVAYSRLGQGQEVYPSEELVTVKENKSKVLYETGGIAALHSQKIGNALRTIDTWYDDAARPIAVEAYGAVTNLGTAYRKPTEKKDFYTLFDRFGLGESLSDTEEHYVMAMLVRGGVFGQSSK
jgi:CRISPR-associated protein Csy3